MTRVLIGVDEAGRGPLAGPVAVGIVRARAQFDIANYFPGLGDSKVLTPARREALYALAEQHRQSGDIDFCVRFSSSDYIDSFGIVRAVRRAVSSGVQYLARNEEEVHVLLDGSLCAPKQFSQETIIRGDATVPLISLASIIAKVRRDRLMQRLAKRYPHYGFDVHKGYGTQKHREAIKSNGLCDIHRRTYIR